MPIAPPALRDRGFPTQLKAPRIDAAAARMARSWGALDLALGEALARLFRGDRLVWRLGRADAPVGGAWVTRGDDDVRRAVPVADHA